MTAINHLRCFAQESHGPGQHGPVLVILVLTAVVAAVIYGVVRLVAKVRARRTRSDRDPENERATET